MKGFTYKLLWRDWRSGELTILTLSLILAISTMTSIGLFTDRIQASMYDEASQLLAADAAVRGNSVHDPAWERQAIKDSLRIANTTSFQAMTFAGDKMQMAEIKAVSEAYPLKGSLGIASAPFGESEPVKHGPKPGEVWLTSRLFSILSIGIGDSIDIGDASFTAAAALIDEPDAGMGALFGGGLRVMMHASDIDKTGAVQLGSRIQYRWLLAGDRQRLEEFKIWLEPRIGHHHNWVDAKEANQSMSSTLQRAERFLLLAGSLSVILAGVAVALSARRFALRQRKVVALLKTLGLTPKNITRMYQVYLLLIGLTSTIIGVVLGWVLHWAIMLLLKDILPGELVAASVQAYWVGGMSGFIALIAFAAPPLLALRQIPPITVIRDTFSAGILKTQVSGLIGVVALLVLVYWYSQSIKITFILMAGIVFCAIGVVFFAWLFVGLARTAGKNLQGHWRLGLANLHRHRHYNIFQIMIFALLMMLLMILALVRTSLIDDWKDKIADDAPNHYIYNVYPEEKDAVVEFLKDSQVTTTPFYPIISGRFLTLNDEELKDILERKQARRRGNYQRELGLTWSDAMGSDNEILEGRWWDEADSDKYYVSIEEKYAKGIDAKLGDTIRLSVSGNEFTAEILSIRSVQWESVNLNFYLIFNRPILDGVGANWATSFYLPEERKGFVSDLMQTFPAITMVEIDNLVKWIKQIISQVSKAIEFILALVLIAGFLVLVTGIQSTLDERLKESAILRTLGGSRTLVNRSLLIEFATLGFAAGIMATLGAIVSQYFMYENLFNIPFQFMWELLLLGPILGALVIGLIGVVSTRKVTVSPPLRTLRGLEAN